MENSNELKKYHYPTKLCGKIIYLQQVVFEYFKFHDQAGMRSQWSESECGENGGGWKRNNF